MRKVRSLANSTGYADHLHQGEVAYAVSFCDLPAFAPSEFISWQLDPGVRGVRGSKCDFFSIAVFY